MPRPRTFLRPWPQLRSYSTRPSLDPSALQRELFRRVAQPVAVLTAHIPSSLPDTSPETFQEPLEHNHGATLSSLTSISLSPPLISFSLRLPSRLATHLSNTTKSSTKPSSFKVHLLSPAQEDLARLFARQQSLPAPAAPSPTTDWSIEPNFDSKVFRALEEAGEQGGLGSIECSVVKMVNLWEIEGSQGNERDETNTKGNQMRSQFFIARVDEVNLGDKEKGGAKGSLVWMEQKYRSIESNER